MPSEVHFPFYCDSLSKDPSIRLACLCHWENGWHARLSWLALDLHIGSVFAKLILKYIAHFCLSEGVLTSCVAILLYFLICDWPEDAKWLTKDGMNRLWLPVDYRNAGPLLQEDRTFAFGLNLGEVDVLQML